ncbi:ubiquitin-conjugating enzyme E2-16 kDa-like [Drosophila innubila]|uniref:ubiquitin-conjugating enzyme E2-16 kDa-like n=1 Tax=Drosophila innubila TaxID=198719 RepID=UPI00148DAC5A|nr:ubiquitin-conjugating enzyme E2-16 kDa-like [Drosophila innubila]
MDAKNRLCKELHELIRLHPVDWCAWPVSGDLMQWEAAILGERGTSYYLGVFSLRLQFNKYYPFIPPRVNFTTKIYHCNIDLDGYICWDLLTTKWTARVTVATIIDAVRDLMRQPNADDPCDEMMAALYRDNRGLYTSNAINWTRRYAGASNMTLPRWLIVCQRFSFEYLYDTAEDETEEEDDEEDEEDELPVDTLSSRAL